MTFDALEMGPYIPRMDDEDEETPTQVKAPIVDSGKSDRLNPEVEYEVLDLASEKPDALKNKLNDLGKEGWQLVSTTPSFIFRRIKVKEEAKLKKSVGFSM
jgi:hypothetical protein